LTYECCCSSPSMIGLLFVTFQDRWLAMLAIQLGTPRGRYDEHSGKFSSVWNQGLIEPVGERNHF
jgi:hypothetical protein